MGFLVMRKPLELVTTLEKLGFLPPALHSSHVIHVAIFSKLQFNQNSLFVLFFFVFFFWQASIYFCSNLKAIELPNLNELHQKVSELSRRTLISRRVREANELILKINKHFTKTMLFHPSKSRSHGTK